MRPTDTCYQKYLQELIVDCPLLKGTYTMFVPFALLVFTNVHDCLEKFGLDTSKNAQPILYS